MPRPFFRQSLGVRSGGLCPNPMKITFSLYKKHDVVAANESVEKRLPSLRYHGHFLLNSAELPNLFEFSSLPDDVACP